MTNYSKLIIKLNIIWAIMAVLTLANISFFGVGSNSAIYFVGMFIVSSIILAVEYFGNPENKS